MGLVKMKELLKQASEKNRAVGAFSVGNLEMVKGAVKAAEEMNTSIILQIAEVRLPHSPLMLMGPMMVEAARNAKVDIAVHLDHGKTLPVLKQALDYGFTSVMMDGSTLPFEENMAKTLEAVRLAREYGATVEAELGLVGGSEDGSIDEGIRCTNPDDARTFCQRTGVDALAVAIGNAHGNYPVAPRLAFDVLKAIDQKLDVPLVLHGGTGITPEDFRKAIGLGIRKINIATASFDSLTKEAEQYLESEGKHDYFGLNEAMVRGVYENVRQHIRIFQCIEPLT
ncbi:class II fructose-bisphosphate aldolase [Lacrimispora saccharolytica]|uniref:Ketose-bisphosphate aldolase n=1 Tax=Lacrimispora saccharolytica (strain ATCC 35040 / DSM 2544 / NRCC 2533 / WM1) TaxID=610130 RepID=D9R1F5_LACSW|nr:class II fructose-bisphosphate aldolase [Lacrimispora saccharolytica]ADL06478.1 ketose-bisphosphate aldolase [[Clostridium] saccharolyticum WM1]QRV19439.1 class II aldolase [Lacrimispora saccharolytica]